MYMGISNEKTSDKIISGRSNKMKKVVLAAVCAVVLVIVAAIIISRPNKGTIEQCTNREELEAKIAKATAEIQKRKMGHVIVGRVVLDGRGNVRDVCVQMEVLSEGYFAGPTKDLDRPVGFRMHQYAPYDLRRKDRFGRCWHDSYETVK